MYTYKVVCTSLNVFFLPIRDRFNVSSIECGILFTIICFHGNLRF